VTRAVFRDAALEQQLRTAGYAIIPCLDPDEVARVRSGFGAIAGVLRGYPFSASIMCGDPDYRAAVHELLSAAFQRAMHTLLVDYRFVFGNFVVKQVGPGSGLPFHQDITFLDEREFDSMNFWVPLDSVLPGGGRLRVVPGSQQLNTGPRGTDRIFPYGELLP